AIGGLNYLWNYTGTGVTISGNDENVSLNFANHSTSGNLSVTVSGNNISTQTSSLPIIVNFLPGDAGIIMGGQIVCQDQGLYYLVPAIGNATNYNWKYSGTGATTVGDSNSVLIYFGEDATSGNLVVEGLNSCGHGLKSSEFPITVNSCDEEPETLDIIIPNAFSPNGDGINDFFVIDGLPIIARLIIFNRSGKKLFTSDNYQNEWNGKDQNGNFLETGTYWYVLSLDGVYKDLKGFVYLKR
ncbi:MAG: gliding motility-associated C-terminal domain-containing protein, partial [Alphaproteobacteria bacterium]